MEQFLETAIRLHGDMVYRLALCHLQDKADAEDVYQEVFLRLFRQGQKEWADNHLKFWLIRTTLHRCVDIGRFRFKKATLPLNEVLAQSPLPDDEAVTLWEAVAKLPIKLRTPIHLHYAEGYSTEEIGEILKIPASTVRTRLHRARKKLKQQLGGYADETDVSTAHETNPCSKCIK